MTTVYMQAYQSGDQLGIQYWFYYPYHDDPETAKDHAQDWWYFWVVYNTTAHSPSKVVYDFHHNLRAFDWTDSRVHKEGTVSGTSGFHPMVYLDAGGHRSMYETGDDVTVMEAAALSPLDTWHKDPLSLEKVSGVYTLADLMGDQDTHTSGYKLYLYGVAINTIPWNINTKGFGTSDDDAIIGLMVKKMWRDDKLAGWRGVDYTDNSMWEVYSQTSKNAGWGEGQTLNVESFTHWVWVAGVDDKYSDTDDKVSYTWSGEDIHNIQGTDTTTGTPLRYLWPKTGTYLPWTGGISWITEGEKARSSTEMVWKWNPYQFSSKQIPDPEDPTKLMWVYWYDWTPISPTISTRYHDGSP